MWEEARTCTMRSKIRRGMLSCKLRLALSRQSAMSFVRHDVPPWYVANMPDGRVKDSGLGREGICFAM